MKFNEAKHLRRLFEAEWEKLFDDSHELVPGILGRAGACANIFGGEFGIDMIAMDPGSFFPLHIHPGHHLLYALHGAGHVTIDGIDYPFRAGDTIYIPAEYP